MLVIDTHRRSTSTR